MNACQPAIQVGADYWRCCAALPLSPSLARRVARSTWREWPRLRRQVAAHIAEWPIWRAGERWRWDLRGRGAQRSRGAEPWQAITVDAWLDHNGMAVHADGRRVEAWALDRLRQDGWEGIHAEGWPWAGLALVLAWDVVMAPANGAWVAPCQVLPADRTVPGFCGRRSAAWAACVAELRRDPLGRFRRSAEHLGLTPDHQPMFAGLPPLPDYRLAETLLSRLNPQVVCDLVKVLLDHPGDAAGLPDLIVWRATTWPCGRSKAQARFVI